MNMKMYEIGSMNIKMYETGCMKMYETEAVS